MHSSVTTENHAHARFTGAYEPWDNKNEIYTVVGTGQQRFQAFHDGEINRVHLPFDCSFSFQTLLHGEKNSGKEDKFAWQAHG